MTYNSLHGLALLLLFHCMPANWPCLCSFCLPRSFMPQRWLFPLPGTLHYHHFPSLARSYLFSSLNAASLGKNPLFSCIKLHSPLQALIASLTFPWHISHLLLNNSCNYLFNVSLLYSLSAPPQIVRAMRAWTESVLLTASILDSESFLINIHSLWIEV